MTTTITRNYKSNIGIFGRKASRKAVSKFSAQYPNTNVKLTNAKIIMKDDEGFERATTIKIKARSQNPLLQSLGKHKATVTQDITRVDGHNNYGITLDNALGKVFEHFENQEKEIASKGTKTKFPILTSLRKTLSRAAKL